MRAQSSWRCAASRWRLYISKTANQACPNKIDKEEETNAASKNDSDGPESSAEEESESSELLEWKRNTEKDNSKPKIVNHKFKLEDVKETMKISDLIQEIEVFSVSDDSELSN
jgi:hypothetical protein